MAKWLDIYSGVLMVRVLISWFPNISWDKQPLSAIGDLCDPYLKAILSYKMPNGMLVQDPTRRGHDVDAIFDQARQMGAMQVPFEHYSSSSSRSFMGTGRSLLSETVESAPRPPENVIHNIYFWSNGFSIDDGPLRRFYDPANASFLEVQEYT